MARRVFDMAQQQGFHFDLLDIGGGFPGESSAKLSFIEVLAT
jgi:ornithine decarboxylase